MASLKEIKGRIGSVEGTLKITSAMKMVASAKLHKAQSAIEGMLPYDRHLHHILVNLLNMPGGENAVSSLCSERTKIHRIAVVAIASNTSLCGSYNANILRQANALLSEYADLGKEAIDFYIIGRKLDQAFSKNTPDRIRLYRDYVDCGNHPAYADAAAIAMRLQEDFLAGRIDRVELLYTHFKSTATQIPTRETFLPVTLGAADENNRPNTTPAAGSPKVSTRYIVEPTAKEVMQSLIPDALCMKIYTCLLDAQAAEHAARTIAMQTATDNANELLDELRRMYNKGRQQAITAELLDIVGGQMQ